jgi:hypothetical protein
VRQGCYTFKEDHVATDVVISSIISSIAITASAVATILPWTVFTQRRLQ